MMVRVELGVNRSIEEFAALVRRVLIPKAAQAGETSVGTTLVTQRNKRFVQVHNPPS